MCAPKLMPAPSTAQHPGRPSPGAGGSATTDWRWAAAGASRCGSRHPRAAASTGRRWAARHRGSARWDPVAPWESEQSLNRSTASRSAGCSACSGRRQPRAGAGRQDGLRRTTPGHGPWTNLVQMATDQCLAVFARRWRLSPISDGNVFHKRTLPYWFT